MKRSQELREQRARLYNQAQALLPKEGRMSAENSAQFDTIMADFDSLGKEVERIERAEKAEAEMGQPLPLNGAPANPGSYASEEGTVDPKLVEAQQRSYRKVFNKYLRRGVQSMTTDELNLLRSQGRSGEYRDQDNVNGPAGGYLIPQGFQYELEVALKQFGGMRAAARTITTATGNQMPWPTTNDTNVMGTRLGANAVTNSATLASQGFGQVPFGAWTYSSGVIRIPNELLNDAAFDLEGEVRDRFRERIGRIQNSEFTNLPASNNGPTGFTTVARVGVTGATGEVSSIIYDDVINLEHAVDPAYRQGAAYMCHDTTLSALRRIKDLYGRPLFGAGLETGTPDKLNGYPIVINQDIAIMAPSAKSLAFGNFSKYIIRDVAGSAVVVRLTELYALQNETAFVAFLRSDGQLVDAGTHPIAVFQNSAS